MAYPALRRATSTALARWILSSSLVIWSHVVPCPVAWENSSLLRSGFREQLVDILPVHQVIDPRLQIIRTAIVIIDVVGVLPDVDAEDRGGAMDQRVLAIGRLGNLELAVLHRQPRPARTELADAGGGKIGLEFLEPAEVFGDLLFQAARQFIAAAVGLHPVPEMQMVVVLAR